MVSQTSHRPLPEALIGRWHTSTRIHPIRRVHGEHEFSAEGVFTAHSWIEEDDEDERINERAALGHYEFIDANVVLLHANDGAAQQRLKLAIELDRYLTVIELDNGNVTRVYERVTSLSRR